MVVTLDRVFEDEAVAELLTTDKLSELACLALYLMYEKKRGEESYWHAYIRELDRQRARGVSAAESPILWDDEELEELLAGSAVVQATRDRLGAMREEYQALDTVWFMSGSLFSKYPYDVPTEAFSFEVFRQAFAAVQASVVHLQGVPLSRRFALVPLGPPCLTYSSTATAMLAHDAEAGEVRLAVDRDYAPGEPVVAWCGPQPNSRLLLNYGIVDEANPYDKVPITATLPNAGPLYQLKRRVLEGAGLASKQTFQLQRGKGVPKQLLPYLRVCYCDDEAALRQLDVTGDAAVGPEDTEIVQHLVLFLQQRLGRYKRTMGQDVALLQEPDTSARQRVACRMLLCEKEVLHEALTALMQLECAPASSDVTGFDNTLLERMSSRVKLV